MAANIEKTVMQPLGSTPQISLAEREKQFHLREQEGKIQLRENFARTITLLFISQTVFLLILLIVFVCLDAHFSNKVLA